MTQTLRRELIQKLTGKYMGTEVFTFGLNHAIENDSEDTYAEYVRRAMEQLADAVLEVRAFSFQPKTIEQAIFAGIPVTEEMVEDERIENIAPKQFENALGFSKPLPWWIGRDWDDFGHWICDRYKENKSCFGEYNIWRNTPYTKGGMSNNRIRGFVKEFYDSWDMFTMSKQPKTDETRGEYKPYTDERDGLEFVSNPKAKR